jgi:hypothetical protein
MNNEPIFSPEYNIEPATDIQPSVQQKQLITEDSEAKEIINKINSDYKLLKPRRKTIRARIIQK